MIWRLIILLLLVFPSQFSCQERSRGSLPFTRSSENIFFIQPFNFVAPDFSFVQKIGLMMASFQVEMASPFGCVLKDNNSRRDRWRDSNQSPNPKPQCNFQRNLKELVRDHLHSCISISPRASNPEPDENSNHQHHHRQSSCCFGGGIKNHHHRWAAQKEAEMVTTIESLRPQQSEICSNDLSVSSLVQRWRGFEVDAKHNHPNNNNNNNVGNNVNAELKVSRADSGVSTCESTMTTATTTAAEDGRESPEAEEEGGERERIRVADIVRKWACDEGRVKGSNIQDQQPPLGACLARLRMGMDSGGGGNVVCSPRIRGRQAIADLFMRIERERSKEVELLGFRHAVTKFPQRGRIQSLLRLTLLRREVSQYEQPPSRVAGSSRCQTASAITSLRERFSATTDHDSANMRSTSRDTPSSNQHIETPSTSKKPSENIRNNSPIEITNNEGEETFPTSNPLNSHHKESHREPHLCAREEGTGQQNALTQVMEVLQEEIPSSEVIREETSYEDDVNLQRQDVGADTTISYNGWEEEEEEEMSYEDQQYFETNLDWISDIARPRSYWEDLRQAWYQEVFNTKSQDEEIRQLLERGSVSAVLASDFRERMDRLVMCSVQRTMHSSVIEEDEVEEEDRSMRAFLEQNMPSFNHHSEEDREEEEQPDQEHVQEEHIEQEEHNREEDEQENEEVSSSMQQQQYHDVSDYYDQNSSSSHLPWDHQYHDHEGISVDSDHAASTSLQQPSPLHSYDRDTQGGSSFKNSSIEMELIYDLRSHMEQIYSEMSELRKSITSCVDMQMKLQHSIREEVSAAISHTDRMERKDSNRRQQKKGNCCICYEKKVDSLLYRCGHMCTCFKCAHELQWSSGKCPICRAQIVDVVRAYADI